MHILVATRNRHKLDEIRAILNIPGVQLVGADEVSGLPEEVVEDADTFAGNAVKKARELCAASGLWTLADDSGLEVDALGGEPGVRSARYAGEPSNAAANNARLLRALAGVGNRAARFRCVLALAAPDGRIWTVDGRCEGRIGLAEAGCGGFGYDPLFIPDGHRLTFAELPAAEKNRISHRGAALAAAVQAWGDWLKP
jgi:XTP/dITP diphosphohydrolase